MWQSNFLVCPIFISHSMFLQEICLETKRSYWSWICKLPRILVWYDVLWYFIGNCNFFARLTLTFMLSCMVPKTSKQKTQQREKRVQMLRMVASHKIAAPRQTSPLFWMLGSQQASTRAGKISLSDEIVFYLTITSGDWFFWSSCNWLWVATSKKWLEFCKENWKLVVDWSDFMWIIMCFF